MVVLLVKGVRVWIQYGAAVLSIIVFINDVPKPMGLRKTIRDIFQLKAPVPGAQPFPCTSGLLRIARPD